MGKPRNIALAVVTVLLVSVAFKLADQRYQDAIAQLGLEKRLAPKPSKAPSVPQSPPAEHLRQKTPAEPTVISAALVVAKDKATLPQEPAPKKTPAKPTVPKVQQKPQPPEEKPVAARLEKVSEASCRLFGPFERAVEAAEALNSLESAGADAELVIGIDQKMRNSLVRQGANASVIDAGQYWVKAKRIGLEGFQELQKPAKAYDCVK